MRLTSVPLQRAAHIAAAVVLASCGSVTDADARPAIGPLSSIAWSDGDSGRFEDSRGGVYKFRIKDIDAPETGAVCSAFGPARCEGERERGFAAGDYARDATAGGAVLLQVHDQDRHGRWVVVVGDRDGQDIRRAGLAAGHYRSWRHQGSRALERRPQWCTSAELREAPRCGAAKPRK